MLVHNKQWLDITDGAVQSLVIPGDSDATGIEAGELLEGTGRQVHAARSAAGAQVDNGGVDESTLVWRDAMSVYSFI